VRTFRCLLVVSVGLLGFVGAAFAQQPAQPAAEAQLQAVREQVFEAHFGEAVTAVRAFLAREDLVAADRNAGLELLAIAQIANRQQAEATQTLTSLYGRDPGHRLTDPDASPPVVSAFARARESHPRQVSVVLAHTPPALETRGAPTIEVQVTEGADAVAEVRLTYLSDEGDTHVAMTRRADGTYVARIPVVGDPSTATDVAYHLTALAPSRTPLATLGSPAEPLQLRIPPEARASTGPVARTDPEPRPGPTDGADAGGGGGDDWWIWTLLAVLVVGAGVTIGVVIATSPQGPEEGTLGSVRLMQLEF
jgi:hypothetical protein